MIANTIFHVTAQFPDGHYKAEIKGSNPMIVLNKLIHRLGLKEMPSDPFLLTVTPKKKS